MINFTYTILYVENVVASIEFYEKAFAFTRRFIAPGDTYGELNTGSTVLAFAAKTLASQNLKAGFIESSTKNKPFGIEIGLTTEDVKGTMQKAVAAGAKEIEPPKEKPWGQTVGYVTDPDGFLIEVCTPMN